MKTKGFTLIELMVSVAIFTIVMTIALGALLSITAAERKAETIKAVINNLHFALDSMSRSIRTGTNYNCDSSGGDCASGGTRLSFLDAQGRTVTYCRGNGSACNALGTSLLQSTGSGFVEITSSEVKINNFAFYVKGAPLGDNLQPRVTITLSGVVMLNTSTQQSAFDIQTTITQRLYDL